MTVAVPGLTPSSEDAAWMRRCAERSQQAAAAGNTPVGALLVVDGRVLAEAAAPCLRCGYAIREARLERVVVGRPSGDTG